jgi:hypothetical protein
MFKNDQLAHVRAGRDILADSGDNPWFVKLHIMSGKSALPDQTRAPKLETDFPATTFTAQRSFPGQEVSKRHLLHRVDHVTVSRFFLACAGSKYRSPKWLPTTYAPGLSKTAARAASYIDRFNYKYGQPSSFLLASSLLQRANRPHNFLTTFSQLSEPTRGSPSTCTLLFPFPARFSALHCSPRLHKRAVVAITPQTPPSPLLCCCSQLIWLRRRYACPGR